MIKTVLAALLVLFSYLAFSQSSEVVYVRTFENYYDMSRVNSYMQITYSDGKNDRIELSKIGIKGDGSISNGAIVAEQIKKLSDLGYELKSHSIAGDRIIVSSMVFIKKDESSTKEK